MAKYLCTCGARYRFPDSAIGKRGKCKKCGAVFTLKEHTDDSIPIADEPDLPVDSHLESPAIPQQATSNLEKVITLPTSSRHDESDSPGLDAPRTKGKMFASDVLRSYLFLLSPASLIVFLVIWFVLVMASLASNIPIAGFIINIFAMGWYTAYRFSVLASAAAGERTLPQVLITTEWLDDYIAPLFKWLGSWIFVLIPAIAYIIIDGDQYVSLLFGGLSGILWGSRTTLGIFEFLAFLGVCFWPMVILCVSLGGISSLRRIDLIFITIMKTFPVYLLTLLFVFGTVFGQIMMEKLIVHNATSTVTAGGNSNLGSSILLDILIIGVSVYFEIALMRLIGLYYYHFKNKFAWSWG